MIYPFFQIKQKMIMEFLILNFIKYFVGSPFVEWDFLVVHATAVEPVQQLLSRPDLV